MAGTAPEGAGVDAAASCACWACASITASRAAQRSKSALAFSLPACWERANASRLMSESNAEERPSSSRIVTLVQRVAVTMSWKLFPARNWQYRASKFGSVFTSLATCAGPCAQASAGASSASVLRIKRFIPCPLVGAARSGRRSGAGCAGRPRCPARVRSRNMNCLQRRKRAGSLRRSRRAVGSRIRSAPCTAAPGAGQSRVASSHSSRINPGNRHRARSARAPRPCAAPA